LINDPLWSFLAFGERGVSLGLVFLDPYHQERVLCTGGGGYGEYYWLYKQDFMNKGDRFREARFLQVNPRTWRDTEAMAKRLPTGLVSLAPEHQWADRNPVRIARKNPKTPENPQP
jgi:hypothetical protein